MKGLDTMSYEERLRQLCLFSLKKTLRKTSLLSMTARKEAGVR